MAHKIGQEIDTRLKKNNFCKLSQLEKYLSNLNMKHIIFQEAVKFTTQGFMLLGYVVYEQKDAIICNYAYSDKIQQLLQASKQQAQTIKIREVQLLALHTANISLDQAVNILSTDQTLIVKKPTTIQVKPPYALDPQYFNKRKQAKMEKQAQDKNQKQTKKQVEKAKQKQTKKQEQLPRIKSKTQKHVQPEQKNQPKQKPATQVVQPKVHSQKKQQPKRKLQIESEDQYNPQEFMKAFENDKNQKDQKYEPEKMQIEEQLAKVQIKEEKQDSGKKTADIQSKSDSDGDDLLEMMNAKKKTQQEPLVKHEVNANKSKVQIQQKTEKIEKNIPIGSKPKQVSLMSMWSKPKA